jgi:tripartite-type tricarboxylate transporter receptor subunit TctC
MSAPPKTPTEIICKLSAAVAVAVKEPDVRRRLEDMGNIEAVGSTPAEMAAFLEAEKARWAAVIKDGRIVAE